MPAVRDESGFLPLPWATLHILLALTEGEKHGYAIMRDVERVSDGAVRMGPGTLYGTIWTPLSPSSRRPGRRPTSPSSGRNLAASTATKVNSARRSGSTAVGATGHARRLGVELTNSVRGQ